jgi:hypothetical protein
MPASAVREWVQEFAARADAARRSRRNRRQVLSLFPSLPSDATCPIWQRVSDF